MGQAAIGGVAATGSAYLGTLIGNQLSVDIPVLSWKSLGFVLLSSAMTNLFFFLKQSPLPAEVTGNTEHIEKT